MILEKIKCAIYAYKTLISGEKISPTTKEFLMRAALWRVEEIIDSMEGKDLPFGNQTEMDKKFSAKINNDFSESRQTQLISDHFTLLRNYFNAQSEKTAINYEKMLMRERLEALEYMISGHGRPPSKEEMNEYIRLKELFSYGE